MTNSQNSILKYLANNIIASLIFESLYVNKPDFKSLPDLIIPNITQCNIHLDTLLKDITEHFLNKSIIYHNEIDNIKINLISSKLQASVFIVFYYKYLVHWLFSLELNIDTSILCAVSNFPNFNDSSFLEVNKEIYLELYNNLDLSNRLKRALQVLEIEDKNIISNILLNKNAKVITKNIINQILDFLNDTYINSLITMLIHSNSVEIVRVHTLGKSSLVVNESKKLSILPAEEKKIKGLFLNTLKNSLNNIISTAKNSLNDYELHQKLLQESVDITLPVYNFNIGGIHPISHVLEEVISIFNELGFTITEGPEIDDEWHNFTALNFNELHPAKDSNDTFYFKENTDKLLRTHTSTVQIRTMQNCNLPIQIIVPGKVYRSDDDATHTPMFHQVEGLYINSNASIAELKYTLINFCRKFFNIADLPLRFRPSYFPFTSPSLEIDINCKITNEGVVIGKGNNWLEILGSGMVHPNVLNICKINPKQYKGFAFGLGIERLAMLKYGFPDLRDFFTSNYIWLRTYNFNPLTTLCKNIK